MVARYIAQTIPQELRTLRRSRQHWESLLHAPLQPARESLRSSGNRERNAWQPDRIALLQAANRARQRNRLKPGPHSLRRGALTPPASPRSRPPPQFALEGFTRSNSAVNLPSPSPKTSARRPEFASPRNARRQRASSGPNVTSSIHRYTLASRSKFGVRLSFAASAGSAATNSAATNS